MTDKTKKNKAFSATDDVTLSPESDFSEGEETGFTGKLKELREELKKCSTERADYLAGWQRAKADYINLKNSAGKEREEIVRYAREELFHDLITLADSFELAFANREVWLTAPENWRKGVEYIYSNLVGLMETHSLVEINPLHEKFNPAEQHSIATVETLKPDEDDKVLEVLKKGYRLGSKVIRPAHVKVGIIKNPPAGGKN